jgi:hypothetical protein
LGLTSAGDGSSGADAELGPGLYVADEPIMYVLFSACAQFAQVSHSAQGFANGNAQLNPGTTAKVCAIFATSSGNWRAVIPKVSDVSYYFRGHPSTSRRIVPSREGKICVPWPLVQMLFIHMSDAFLSFEGIHPSEFGRR